jgi:hypothetical protein
LAASEAALLLEKYGALRVTRHPVADFVAADDPGAVDTVAAMNSDPNAALNAAETRERVVSAADTPAVTTSTTTTTQPVTPPVTTRGGARAY